MHPVCQKLRGIAERFMTMVASSGIQPQRQYQERNIRRHTQASQNDDHVAASPKSEHVSHVANNPFRAWRRIREERWVSIPLPAQPIFTYFTEELSIPLHSPESAHGKYPGAINREQRSCLPINHFIPTSSTHSVWGSSGKTYLLSKTRS